MGYIGRMTRKTFRYPTSKPSILDTIPHWRSLLRDRLRERETSATIADFFEILGIAEVDRCHGDGIRIGMEVQRLKWSRASRVVEENGQRRVRMHYSPPRRRNTANRDATATRARKVAEAEAAVAAASADAHKEWYARQGASDAENQSRPRRALYTYAPPHPAPADAAQPHPEGVFAHAIGHLIPAIAAYRRERGVTLAEAATAFKAALKLLESAAC